MKQVSLSRDWFHGAVSVSRNSDGWQPWRLPHDKLALFPPDDALPMRAAAPAGVRIVCTAQARRLNLQVVPAEAPRTFDLVRGRRLVSTTILEPGAAELQLDAGDDVRPVEIWLPLDVPVVVRSLGTDAPAEPASVDRRRWLTYGGSITHAIRSHSPARSWPALAARELDWHLTCLGYGGNCHLEAMIGRMIRDLPADLITLKLGINVYGAASLSHRTFKPAVIGLVQLIREGHAETPLVVISPIVSPPRENEPNPVGLSLSEMREQIADAVLRMQAAGDANLHYASGLEMFNSAHAAYLPDALHPDAAGNEVMGRNFVTLIKRFIPG